MFGYRRLNKILVSHNLSFSDISYFLYSDFRFYHIQYSAISMIDSFFVRKSAILFALSSTAVSKTFKNCVDLDKTNLDLHCLLSHFVWLIRLNMVFINFIFVFDVPYLSHLFITTIIH